MSSDLIQFQNITKTYGDTRAVDDVSFSIADGEFLALVGPSGSGKSTTLRMLAGFDTPTTGRITLDGRSLNDVPPHKRDTTMVFQDYALFPHMTVGENIAFGLKRRGDSADAIDSRIDEVLDLVDLGGLRDRNTATLSGGQQQRVATARALAPEPKVLLMDEPLGALDKKLRDRIKVDFSRLQRELGITTLYVTHNQDEALTMADRVAVMNNGEIEQLGPPEALYDRPKTRFVADFIGDTNFIDGTFTSRNGSVFLEAHGQTFGTDVASLPGTNSTAFVRPENIAISEPGNVTGENTLEATVSQVHFVGSMIRYFVTVDDTEYIVETNSTDSRYETGDRVTMSWSAANTRVVDA
ncbi:ABC transporter ATP-binding protein [Natrialbaceae archaeon A-chndr2]|uniref:ABC transporter ATP-binding protein n=1 Tax=Natronosalvus amylolyticus TaxID=2961994 RepID=UPI0020C9BDE2|nr:ABC transporter ATP-binding protein [Natronosalvus amylolyticus]